MKAIYAILCFLLVVPLTAQTSEPPYYAGDHAIIFLPTAYTQPVGSHFITNLDFLGIQYSYGLKHAQLSLGTILYPLNIFTPLTIGAKINYDHLGKIQCAAVVTTTPGCGLLTLGNVVSYGSQSSSLNLATGVMFSLQGPMGSIIDYGLLTPDFESQIIIALGGIGSISTNISFFFEIIDMITIDGASSDKPYYVPDLGIRFKGKHFSMDLGGFWTIGTDYLSHYQAYMTPILKLQFAY